MVYAGLPEEETKMRDGGRKMETEKEKKGTDVGGKGEKEKTDVK